jgi:hypothetical protein
VDSLWRAAGSIGAGSASGHRIKGDHVQTDALRDQLVRLLQGSDTRMTFEDAVADFPDEAINRRAPNVDYTPWHLLEHVRLTQADILDYVTNDEYAAPAWPNAYWPDFTRTATRAEFDATIRGFLDDLASLQDLVRDPERDLFAILPGTPGHTLLREIRVVADHNAYHVGEFAILRQVMGTWPPTHAG